MRVSKRRAKQLKPLLKLGILSGSRINSKGKPIKIIPGRKEKLKNLQTVHPKFIWRNYKHSKQRRWFEKFGHKWLRVPFFRVDARRKTLKP